uniref:Uncharacterized protein n=1 Tax=Nelumbo nucifera TaxID=4432 RepID=A0A822YH21_NELNU|nr:TPA_asm: hypothetical protein HUJ06_009612 [Nelumbo nucifera]
MHAILENQTHYAQFNIYIYIYIYIYKNSVTNPT